MRRLLTAVLLGVVAVPGFPPATAATQCVGSPARQTTDPMSPPCIPSWSGDNGGGTWDGVTRDTVRVLLYNDLGIAGNLNLPWQPADEASGSVADPSGSTTNLVRTAKALVSHFNARYQTYGRTVQVIGLPSTLGETSVCGARTTDVDTGIGAYRPFIVAAMGSGQGCVFDSTERANIVGLGLAEQIRDAKVPATRKAFTFAPTVDAQAEAAAGFICKSLSGRPAQFAGTLLRGRPRTFALLYPTGAQSWVGETAALLTESLAGRCGGQFSVVRAFSPSLPSEIANAVIAARNATTMVCLCPAPTQDAHKVMAAATAVGYDPEWLWLPLTKLDQGTWQRTLPHAPTSDDPLGAHFGISAWWNAPAPESQQAVRAAIDGDPALRPNARWTTELFVTLRLAFTGIQVAGPTLNPTTITNGLVAFQPTAATGELAHGSFADPGPRVWTDTFAAWWFDSDAVPPGDRTPRGCIRQIQNGARFTAATWPSNDLDIEANGACIGDLQRQPVDEPVVYASGIVNSENV